MLHLTWLLLDLLICFMTVLNRFVLCALALLPSLASAAQELMIADFESTASSAWQVRADEKVTSSTAEVIASGSSSALKYSTRLEGPGAQWGGIRIETPGGLPAGTDTFRLDVQSEGRSGLLHVGINDRKGARWTAALPMHESWSSSSLPLYKFTASKPEKHGNDRPSLQNVSSIDLWVENTFQGVNGFVLDNLRAVDAVPVMTLQWSAEELTHQTATTVTLEARETTGGPLLAYTGPVWLGVENRLHALLPQQVELRDGKAEIEVFPRIVGPLRVYAYEPYSAYETVSTFTVKRSPLTVNFSIQNMEGQQVMVTNAAVAPKLSIQGGSVPLTAHLVLRDHKQDTVISSYFSVAALQGGHGKLMVPRPGLFEARVRLLREPLSELPHVPENLPVRAVDVSTTTPEVLPDGVTTRTVLAHQVYIEELPTTATVMGEDRFPLLVQLTPPKEVYFNRWQFGIGSGEFFELPVEDYDTTGRKQLRWYRRLGSSWASQPIAWAAVNPVPNGYQWQKANEVVNTYREMSIKLLGVLNGNPGWDSSESPSTTQTLSSWGKWVAEMNSRYMGKIWAWQVWSNPDQTWSRGPSGLEYRELVKSTWNAVRTSGTQVRQGPRVVAGATAGYEPVFLEQLCSDGYAKYFDTLSFNFYPQARSRSPEENGLSSSLREAWLLYRKHNLHRVNPSLGPAQMWITDFGWPNAPNGVTEELQANYLVRTYATGLHNRLLKLFWQNLLDKEALPWRGGFEDRTGLLDTNYQPKLSAVAYNLASFMMTSMTPAAPPRQEGKATIYSFNIEEQSVKWPGILHIGWTPQPGDEEMVELPIVKDDLYVFDYLGADRPGVLVESGAYGEGESAKLQDNDERTTRTYRFRINYEPVYIWDAGAGPQQEAVR